MTASESDVCDCDKMDSAKDAYKQCEAGPINHLLRNEHQFCKLPSCLGKPWHEWGCCSLDSTALNDYEVLTEKDEVSRSSNAHVQTFKQTLLLCIS